MIEIKRHGNSGLLSDETPSFGVYARLRQNSISIIKINQSKREFRNHEKKKRKKLGMTSRVGLNPDRHKQWEEEFAMKNRSIPTLPSGSAKKGTAKRDYNMLIVFVFLTN